LVSFFAARFFRLLVQVFAPYKIRSKDKEKIKQKQKGSKDKNEKSTFWI
jgi:hypothetical protein